MLVKQSIYNFYNSSRLIEKIPPGVSSVIQRWNVARLLNEYRNKILMCES